MPVLSILANRRANQIGAALWNAAYDIERASRLVRDIGWETESDAERDKVLNTAIAAAERVLSAVRTYRDVPVPRSTTWEA